MYLLNRSPDRGAAFEIVCVVTSEDTFDEEVRVERRGIPVIVHPIAPFHGARGAPTLGDERVRREYDGKTLERLDPYFADLILLDGYVYLVTAPLLRAFPNRIINLHFSDLTLRGGDGGPRFPGIRAVRDAMAAGCPETRATVHLVNDRADEGAPIVLSWPFAVSRAGGELRTLGASQIFRAYSYAHQQWMTRTVSGPLVNAALRLVATGAVDLADLAGLARGVTRPWLLCEDGKLVAPHLEPAGARALAPA